MVLALKEKGERSKAYIQALGIGLAFPPINTVLLSDLRVVEVGTFRCYP